MAGLPSVKSDDKYTDRLYEFHTEDDIPLEWRGSPIEEVILSQNFGRPIQTSGNPELLICTCIEFRYALPIPRMYAYVIRRASGRIIGSEFSVGYTLSKGVKHLLLIGHNDCGMSKVPEAAPSVVQAFVEQGWSEDAARIYVHKHGIRHAMGDELDSLKDEYLRLRAIFPKLVIAPVFVCLHDNKLYLPKWYPETYKNYQADPSGKVPLEVIMNLP